MIEIDEEFQKLIPPLADDEFRQLEENCVKEGIRDPLVVWEQGDKDILVDGHNRWKISANHGGIQFQIVKKHFDSREDAIVWICKNQLGRRNLNKLDAQALVERSEEAERAKAKKRQATSTGGNKPQLVVKSSQADNGKTRDKMGKLIGVSGQTYDRLKKINHEATPQVKQAVRDGKLSINQAYNSTFPKVLDPVREAKERHEAFQEKAKEDVVNFKDAMLDKYDQNIIYHDFVRNLYKPLTAVNGFGLLYQTKDMEKMIEKIPDDLAENIVFKINHCIKILELVRTTIERRTNEKH